MEPYLTDVYGNPGSIHQMGREAAAAVERAREQVMRFMGAEEPEQIIFTSGGTEGNNLVFKGIRYHLMRIGRTAIITTAMEHDSVLHAIDQIISDYGAFQKHLITANSEGVVTTGAFAKKIMELHSSQNGDIVGLVSVMSANNELGTLNPVYGICCVAHRFGALFHTDAVQIAGMYPLNVKKNDYDFVTISSHKIHGPKGMGALYVKDPQLMRPLIAGGSHQEFGLRGGTENVAGIVGFGKACELMNEDYEERSRYRDALGGAFLRMLIKEIGGSDQFSVNGNPPMDFKTISLRFDGIDAQTLLLMLDSKDICVSAGSACTAHEDTPSHVLTAIGLTAEEARSTIRISFSDLNTLQEAEEAGQILADCVKVLRKL